MCYIVIVEFNKETMMTLKDALTNAPYIPQWAIFAQKIDGKFELNSPARYAPLKGGLIDDDGFEFVCPGDFPADARELWGEDGGWDKFLVYLIEQLNDET